MVYKRIKAIKITVFIFVFILFFCNIFNTVFKNGLAEAVLDKDYIQNSSIMEIVNKSSNTFSIIFEADSKESVLENKKDFIKNFKSEVFEIVSFDIDNLLKFYSKSPTNFLSDNTKEDIKNKNYEKLFNNAIFSLYSPTGFNLFSFTDDPYFLFNDFLIQNSDGFDEVKKIDNKYYTYINLAIKNNCKYSNKQINDEIKKLTKENKELRFCGSLIHSYQTTKYTSFFVNLICFLSVLFIVFLIYFCFKSIKPVFFISISILFGFLAGFCAVKTLFSAIHIITILFATTLIGIGIDYSIHYFYCKNNDKSFFKNLSVSYLTTAVAFGILYLSNVELLKQISIFMIFGLLGIYLTVLAIYPCFDFDFEVKNIELNLNKKTKTVFCAGFILLSLVGLLNLKFDDSLSSLYIPNKKLKQNEIIYNKITNSKNLGVNFVIIKGDNIEQILQKEEMLNKNFKKQNIKYISLSKFIPSKKTQSENIKLVSELYLNNLNKFSDILAKNTILEIKNKTKNQKPIEFDINNSSLNYFLLRNNRTFEIVYSNDISKIENNCDEIINIKSDIAKTLKNHRIILLKLLPVAYIILFALFVLLYGIQKGLKMYLPVILSVVFAFCVSNILNMSINLFSVISLFLITGFTIDYSIFRFNGKNNNHSAILISALTTSFSFLLLSFTPFKLISSISTVLCLGIVASYFLGQVFWKEKIN